MPPQPAITLREPSQADAAALADFARHAFTQKFAHLYAAEDLNPHLVKNYTAEGFAAEIAQDETPIMLAVQRAVVGQSGALAGFCKLALRPGWPEFARGKRGIEIKQLYTAPELTGQGIGALLMDWAAGVAQKFGADEIQLSVYSNNHGAQKFYQRYGFSKVADIDYWVGNHRDDEFLFAKLLPGV